MLATGSRVMVYRRPVKGQMSDSLPDRRLVSVLCADLVGYSRLMRADEEGTLIEWRGHMQELIRPTVARHRGRLVKTTGDGFIATFDSPVEAVRCGVDIQDGMAARTAGTTPDRRQQFRIGVNLGDIIVTDDDVHGDAVNVAARLQTLAEPGTVFLSATVYDHVRDHLDRPCVDLGEQTVKNIDRPFRVFCLGGAAGIAHRRRWRPTVAVVAAILLCIVAGMTWWWRWGPPTADLVAINTSQQPSIAVLSFSNQSDDASQEYFSDGVTEDIIAALGRFPWLTVMARNAVLPYKGKKAKPAEIGRELGVRYLVEGSVRRANERIRVSAQLTDAVAGKLLWSQRFDEELKDVFALQEDVARKVAGTLATNLTRLEQQRAGAKRPENLNAYDLVLRARELLLRATRSTNRDARRLLQLAIRLDPNYADAYAWLSAATYDIASLGWSDAVAETLAEAESLALKARALDDNSAAAHRMLGRVYAADQQLDRSLAEMDRALALNPSDAEAYGSRGATLLWMGRTAEAIKSAEIGLALDPNPFPSVYFNLGLGYYLAGRFDDTIRLLERAASRYPSYAFITPVLAAAYAEVGRKTEATQAVSTALRQNPYFDPATYGSRLIDPEQRGKLAEGLKKAGF